MPLPRNRTTTGHSREPSESRRMANNAMSANKKELAQTRTPTLTLQRQQPEADDVEDRAGHHPGPTASPPRHGSVAQPSDEDGREQRKDTAGGRHPTDQEIGIAAGDEGSANRDESDVNRLPVGAAAEPECI